LEQDGGIIAGEGRLRAAQKLGMREVPVIVLGHLSEVQRRALSLADNQLALNLGWDEQMLGEQLAALRDEDFNLDVLGFDEQELARQLAEQEAAAGLTDEDEIPTFQQSPRHQARRPLAVALWQRVPATQGYCAATQPPKKHYPTTGRRATPILMVTDPPYGVDLEPQWREDAGLNPRTRQGGTVANDDRSTGRRLGRCFRRCRLRLACRHSRRRSGAGPANLRIPGPVADHLGEAALRHLTRRLPLAA